MSRERSECFGHGTTHVIFEPLDFVARLAALAPKTLALLAGQALEKILTHVQEKLTPAPAGLRPASRAPPADLFG